MKKLILLVTLLVLNSQENIYAISNDLSVENRFTDVISDNANRVNTYIKSSGFYGLIDKADVKAYELLEKIQENPEVAMASLGLTITGLVALKKLFNNLSSKKKKELIGTVCCGSILTVYATLLTCALNHDKSENFNNFTSN